jgi:PKHD-type hydroxylase
VGLLLVIENVLSQVDVEGLRADLERLDFCDGRASAGWAARLVKHNKQAAPDPAAEAWRDRIATTLLNNAVFGIAAYPKRIIGPLFSRYAPGDHYGNHVDEPILDGHRSDLSFTLFLTDPSHYDGGELVIDTASGEEAMKLEPGSAVLYPATTLHRVAAVTRGTRYAGVGWVRSLIRSAEKRELLFDLETARRRLFDLHGKTTEFDLLSKCVANLVRMWCDD